MVNELQEVQWAYLIDPCFQIENTAGRPNTGGWINIYIAGTRTKYYAASDFSGTLHPFNIPLDSLGSNIILVSPANKYDIYVLNKFGTLVMSRYNVSPQVAGTSIVSGGVVLDSSDGTITIEQTGDNIYNLSIADIIDSVTANIDESITNIEGDITEINQDITNITNVVTGLPTHGDVYDAVVTGIDYTIDTVTGLIPQAQVQSDWDETDPADPAYILNKPDLDNYVTIDELTEVISGVTGFNLEMGQFYCQTTTGGAVMGRTKGNIEVTNDGKIKLKKGQSYHVTVRGGYSKTTASADYNVLSYIEYITGQNINVNVDNSVTDTQYFEISYDIYKLSSDKDYYVFFSLPTGSSVNNLFIEIHSIGCMGTGGSGSGVPVEYDAGWGINIIDNVISVDPSILNQYVTEGELATAIENLIDTVTGLIPEAQVQADWDETDPLDPSYINNKPDLNIYVTQEELASAVSGLAPEYTAGDNIEIDNDVISVSNPTYYQGETDTGYISVGNITHWNEFTEAPGIILKSHTSSVYPGGETDFEWHVTPDHAHQVMAWGEYDVDYETNTVSATKFMTIGEGDIVYASGAFQDTNTLPVIWSCSQMAQDISELQEAITAVSGSFVQEQSDWAEQDSTKVDYIKNKPVEKQLIAGTNIDISESATGVIISASGSTYSAGNGIDITNDTISIDNTVALKSDIPDVSNFVTETELQDGLELVTGLIPDTDDLATKAELQDNIELVTGLIPAAQVNSDWNANSGVAEILNKPTEKELVAGTNITITESATGIVISSTGGGGGSSYTAGNGIDITSDVISVDNTVAMKTDIPDITGLATKTELQDGLELVTGLIPDYTPSYGIDITNDEISAKLGANMSFDTNDAITVDLTGVAEDAAVEAAGLVSGNIPHMELVAGNRIQIATSGVSAVINAVIPDAAKDAIFANSYDNPGWETTGTVTTYNPLGLAIHPDLAYDSYTINASRLCIKEIGSGIFYLDLFLSMTGTPKVDYATYQNYITLTNGHFVCPTNSNVYDEWNSCFGSIHQDTLYGTGLDFNATKPYDATRKHYVQLHTIVANW